MKTLDIINELEETKQLSAETIEQIEENEELRYDLVNYFSTNKNRTFALELLRILTNIRRDHDGIMSGESLMLACYILGKHNQIEDCMAIWETKTIDFDTFCYIDIQLMPFAGVNETIAYLKTQTSKESSNALEYVIGCKKAGDFNNLKEYYGEKPWFL